MKLSALEKEFLAEMAIEPGTGNEWANFDPPFRRRAYERFLRKGWLEYRGDGQHRDFRWTPAGRNALDKERGE